MDKVILTVEGSQIDILGDTTSIEFIAEGQYCQKNGISYILYNETKSSGMEGTKTLLKIADNTVHLIRKGNISQQQFFSDGVKSDSQYQTPYGSMKIAVLTKKITIEKGTISSSVYINYDMLINGAWQSNNELHIEVTAADRKSEYLN
ncbi:DUF1934 domain-containing protein [Pectinatus sottacetonis]|uniref:DUF1934 domain-containing protein n=1 Tax=Pectinatus sottacetonis TaxID=1002795 RepID=UPI0018C6344B|nr:DUF1934 domain-containing protein [Pectinatus sottacetonis]